MQMVVHDKFQSHRNADSSSVIQSGPGSSKINSASEGEKDGSKVRMPSVIAKLMGLENLPSSTSTTTKTVAERKGTERFVKPGAVPRMEIKADAMNRKLPIRIIASEKGQHKIVLSGEWKTNFGDSEMGAAALSNSSSHPATATGNSRQGRLTMREVLRKMVAAERGADEKQEVEERIIHEDKGIAEEIKLQNSVSVGCRADSGKRMDFLKRFRKNSDNNRPVKEEKQSAQEKSAAAGKKQATGMRRLLGRDGEAKSRKAREKLNKENLATAETKAAGKNGKTDQVKHQAQSKHVDRQSKPRKPQNRREMQSETPSRKLENKKKALMPEAGHMKKKPEYTVVTQQENEELAKEHVSFSKPADSTHGEGGLSEPLAIVVRGRNITGAASLDQPLQKITEGSSEKATETPREPQNRRATHSEAPNRKLENKKSLLSEAGHMRKKLEYTVVAQEENEVDAKVNDTISSNKPADSTHGGVGLSEPLTVVVRDSSTAEAISLDQPLQKITEGISDPTIPAETVVHASEDLKFLDQIPIAEINKKQLTEDLKVLDQSTIPETNVSLSKLGTLLKQSARVQNFIIILMKRAIWCKMQDEWVDHTPSETTQMPETFAEEEQQEQEQQTIVIREAFTEEEEQRQQMIVKEHLTDGSNDHTTTSISTENLQDHKTHVVTCDSLTENQLLLMRLLVKDRYLLETAKAIVRVDAPVSFIDADAGAPNWSVDKGNDLLSDVAREVVRRKGKRSEAMEEVSVARAANLRLQYLDDLVRELDGDVESLDMSKSKRTQQQGDNRAAENLRRILESDIQNDHPDANSTWDFGWNRVWELPMEKGDVVRDLEKNILGGIITDVARDLIGVSVRHGCCPCVA
ncbi:unnamed protein product [Triticum turgidum subsp. durum]|uniref:DUF3741 domain-containing protein n=1 Tax=Triticum turgidum subsp. durum TaxID=4567 RepID=A0A9R0WSR1_TRITD|nr:unnamed protein product [Triticum turgidum subsp. durum]